MKDIASYKTILFDCDGVILNSNKIKTRAFRLASIPFGKEASNTLEDYHLRHGGISRYEKFDYFLTTIVQIKCREKKDLYFNKMLEIYAAETTKGLLDAEITYGLEKFRDKTKEASWLVVSGGDQQQLNYVLKRKNIIHLFDGGVFGSPDKKNEIITREMKKGNINLPALSLGDSALDHKVSIVNGIDFIFVSGWTEFRSYKQYCLENSIKNISKVYELIA